MTRAVLTVYPPRRTICNLPAQMTGFCPVSSTGRAGGARLQFAMGSQAVRPSRKVDTTRPAIGCTICDQAL